MKGIALGLLPAILVLSLETQSTSFSKQELVIQQVSPLEDVFDYAFVLSNRPNEQCHMSDGPFCVQ